MRFRRPRARRVLAILAALVALFVLVDLAYHAWTEPAERVLAAAELAGVDVVVPRPGESVEPGSAAPVRALVAGRALADRERGPDHRDEDGLIG